MRQIGKINKVLRKKNSWKNKPLKKKNFPKKCFEKETALLQKKTHPFKKLKTYPLRKNNPL